MKPHRRLMCVCVCACRTKPPLAGLPDLHDGLLLHADLHHRGLLLQVRAHLAATGHTFESAETVGPAAVGGERRRCRLPFSWNADVSVAHWLSLPVDV